MKRTALAFAIAPMVYAITLFLFGLISGKVNEGVWALVFISSIAYAIVFILGLPVYLILQKLNYKGLRAYLFVGTLLAVGPIVLFVLFPRFSCYSGDFCDDWIDMAAVYGSLHILAATLITVFSFWAIARPDRSTCEL